MTRKYPARPLARQSGYPDRLDRVVVRGVVIADVRVMESAYEGVCKQTGKPIHKGDLMIYKHADKLTDAEHDAWCRAIDAALDSPKAYRAVVALYDEVINQRAEPALAEVIVPEVHGDRPVAKRRVVLGPPKEPPSKFQEHILNVLWARKCHIVIKALAGCGKTNTLRRIAWALRNKLVTNRETGKKVSLMHGRSVTYLAYNRRLKDEVEPLLFGTGVDPRTTHSFFLRVLGLTPDECDYDGNLDRERFMLVLCNRAGLPFNDQSIKQIRKESEFYKLRGVVQQLIDFTKHWAILPAWTGDCWVFGQEQRRQMSDLIDKYRMLVDDEVREDVISLAAATIAVGIPHPGGKPSRVTGEDILYLPLVLNSPLPKLDMVLADEIQDFNLCQIMLVRRLADAGARIIAVGDPLQAIYRFRGATGRSFEWMEQSLSESAKGAETCILPINYRSGKAVIANSQRWAPELQGFKTDEGEVRDDATFASMVDWFATGDTSSVCVLSRTNDPLFKAALETLKEFIRQRVTNKRVCVLGKRSIGRPLISLVEQVSEETDDRPKCIRISDRLNDQQEVVEAGLLSRIDQHVAQHYAKFGQDERYAEQLARLSSNVECIKVVCQMVADDKVKTVIKTIDALCTDKPRPGDIVFSTVHGAKGLEWRDVFVIKCDLFPFPTVKMYGDDGEITEEGQEELNIMYVRDTRPIMNLYYVADWIEKDQSGTPIDVHSLMDVDRKYGEDGGDVADFWEEDRPERPVAASTAVRNPVEPFDESTGQEPIPARDRKAEFARIEAEQERRAFESDPDFQRAKARAVHPKNNLKKWVDSGEPF